MSITIPYTKPSITEHEVALATDAVRHGWGNRCYDYIEQFEKNFGAHIGSEYALATSSCTGALQMGLHALGIGQGDEVILADINWVATASPIVHRGAQPIFIDILPDSWCLDPDRIEAAISPRTRAIVATHLYGNPCRMKEILELGERHGIPVLEDAAEAIGTRVGKQSAGASGRFGVFSFHGTKTLTTGEGGMLVTNDKKLFDQCLILAKHGQSPESDKQFWAEVAGYKFRMSNVQAAIGCGQLSRVNELVARKREIFHLYSDRLEDWPVRMNIEPEGTINGFWMPTIVFDESVPFDRENLLTFFASEGIDARVFFWPLSDMPPFRCEVDTPVSHSIHRRAINLPSFHDMTESDIDKVCDLLAAKVSF